MRLAVRTGLAALLLAAAGCSAEVAGNGSWTPPERPTGQIDRSQPCVNAQRREVRVVASGLQRVIRQVLARPEEPQPQAAARARAIVHGVERRVAARCGDRTDLEPLVGVVDTRVGDARDALDEPTLRLVVGAFRAWTRQVGASRPGTVYYHRDPCVPFRRRVDISFRIAREPEPGGTVARVELVVANRLDEGIYVEHGGRIRVAGLAPGGASKRLSWGGSSADTAVARAGRTSRTPVWPAPLPDVDIHLLPGASLELSDVYAAAYAKVSCRVPIDLPGRG